MLNTEKLYQTPKDLEIRISTFGKYFQLEKPHQSEIQEMIGPLEEKRILDAGCGIGIPLLPFGPQLFEFPDMMGLDLSTALLSYVRERQQAQNLPFKLIQADIQNLPVVDKFFDLILCRHMLYHVSNISKALSEFKRVLKPTGILIATTNSQQSKPELHKIHQDVLSSFPQAVAIPRISSHFSAEIGERILRRHFENVRMIPWYGVFRFPDVKTAMDYYSSTAYFQQALSEIHDRQKLYNIVKEKIQTIINTNQVFTVHHWGAIFSAKITD